MLLSIMQATIKAVEVVRKMTRTEAVVEADHGQMEERRESSSLCFWIKEQKKKFNEVSK